MPVNINISSVHFMFLNEDERITEIIQREIKKGFLIIIRRHLDFFLFFLFQLRSISIIVFSFNFYLIIIISLFGVNETCGCNFSGILLGSS